MYRAALLTALLLVPCKKQQSGDVGPSVDPNATASTATAPPAAPAPTPPPAGMGSPHGTVPEKTAPKVLDPLPDGRLAMGPFSLVAPAGWTPRPVTSSMRAAQFQVSAKPGAEADLVVTYFGARGAGNLDENIDRWVNQFTQPDGKKSRDAAKIEKVQLAGQDATVISVSGHYAASAMPGAGGPVDKADQSMLAAIVSSPEGPYYFKLVADKATIDANAKAFRSLLDSLKLR